MCSPSRTCCDSECELQQVVVDDRSSAWVGTDLERPHENVLPAPAARSYLVASVFEL